MKSIDPTALDALVALADDGSFERAAQRLAVTQSAVSQRLRALETQCGRPLVVRSRPLRLTEAGSVLLRYARQMQALRAGAMRALDSASPVTERLPIAVNADSLATWLLAVLDPIVQEGLDAGHGLELVVDDQNFTHEWLRQGAVLGCVSAEPQALQGCLLRPLGCMRYTAVATRGFVDRMLPAGLHRGNFAQVPFLAFNRKDDMHHRWVAAAFDVASPRLNERYVPSSEAYAEAVRLGWGVGVLADLQSRGPLERGELVALAPEVTVDVMLYWHQWKLGVDAAAPSLLDRVGAALQDGGRRHLHPAPS